LWLSSIPEEEGKKAEKEEEQEGEPEQSEGDSKKRKRGAVETTSPSKKQKTGETASKNRTPKNLQKFQVQYRHFHIWLMSLPKYLWEVKASQPEISKVTFFPKVGSTFFELYEKFSFFFVGPNFLSHLGI
jgi:hypothetical protein